MSVDTKYGEAIFKQTQEVAEMFKAAMPKITTNKNGYEASSPPPFLAVLLGIL